jgi:replicative DNA helicase
LTELITQTPPSIHVEYYANLVRKYARLRRLIVGAGKISRLAYAAREPEKVLAQIEAVLLDLTREAGLTGGRMAGRIVESYLERVGQDLGLSTGLESLDHLCGRLQRSDLVLLAGRPGMMKTTLALKIARSNARVGKHVAIYSLEMSDEQLVQRLIASETGIPPQRLRLGDIQPDEWPGFTAATQMLAEIPIHIDDAPALSVQELRGKARRLNSMWGIDLIIVDYLQLMRSGRKSDNPSTGSGCNRVQEVSAIGRGLKALARELNIPVLAISILSRACELRPNKRPILSDLRESGTLEYEADIVWFCYRDELYNPDTELVNILELIQAKWRHGPTGTIKLYCHKDRQDFSDADKHIIRLDDLAPVNDF